MALHHRFALLVALAGIPLELACSGADPSPGGAVELDRDTTTYPSDPAEPPSEAPSPDAGGARDTAEGESGGSTCSALVNVAPEVQIVAESSDPPPATGGAIADGTYVARNATIYTGAGGTSGPTGSTLQMTVAIAGSLSETVTNGVASSSKMTTSGNQLTYETTCPAERVSHVEYSATPTSLTIHLVDSKGTRVYSLERL